MARPKGFREMLLRAVSRLRVVSETLLGITPSISSMRTSQDPAASNLGLITVPVIPASTAPAGGRAQIAAKARPKGASCQHPARNAHSTGI